MLAVVKVNCNLFFFYVLLDSVHRGHQIRFDCTTTATGRVDIPSPFGCDPTNLGFLPLHSYVSVFLCVVNRHLRGSLPAILGL